MITTLLYLLFKKLLGARQAQLRKHDKQEIFNRSNLVAGFLIILLLLVSGVVAAQKQLRNYKILRKGKEIGWTSVQKQTDGSNVTISLGSEVSVRIILNYESVIREVSKFQAGKLQHSYYFRRTNGSVKVERNTKLAGTNYEIEDGNKTKLNITPVTYNTLCMYFQEPVNITQVYSDNHQRLLDIERKPDGGYRIVSPDKTSNTFYYTGGICYKVKIDHSFYSAELRLK